MLRITEPMIIENTLEPIKKYIATATNMAPAFVVPDNKLWIIRAVDLYRAQAEEMQIIIQDPDGNEINIKTHTGNELQWQPTEKLTIAEAWSVKLFFAVGVSGNMFAYLLVNEIND